MVEPLSSNPMFLPWRAEGQFVLLSDGRSVCRVNGMPQDAELIARAVNSLSEIDRLTAEIILWKANTSRMSKYFEETAHERDRLTARVAELDAEKHELDLFLSRENDRLRAALEWFIRRGEDKHNVARDALAGAADETEDKRS